MNESLLQIAIKAALESGQDIMKIYNRDFTIAYKEDSSPLTEADLTANKTIMKYLMPTNIPIISEENKQLDYNERKHWESCWIVDPLDGTKEFVKKNDEFTVNIALVNNGKLLLGVIYAPALKLLYFTNEDKSAAFRIEVKDSDALDGNMFNENNAIHPSKSRRSDIKVVASRSHLNEATTKFIENIKDYDKVEMVSKGSSLKFCLVAEGKADLYPRFAPTMEWDTAAGQAICEAVGLQVLDLSTQKPMVYNRANLLNNHFLVSKNGTSIS